MYELCLNVIGAYIDWIDLSCVANDDLLPLIVRALCSHTDVVDAAACDCLCSVLAKGMPPVQKTQLLAIIDNALVKNAFYEHINPVLLTDNIGSHFDVCKCKC